MKKKTVKTIIAIIALLFIYWIYQSTIPHEISDDTFAFLESLKQETQIDFSEIKDFELKWITEAGSVTLIHGKGFRVIKSPKDELNNILSFFNNSGFKANINNTADGEFSWLRGYIKNKDVCVVIERLAGYEEIANQQIPSDLDKRDIFVRCGKLE